jgi:hypothetical protein
VVSKRPWVLPTLAAVQLILAVVLAALCALHIYLTVLNSRQVRRFMECNVNQQAFNGLVNESIAYATRTNPAVLPALAEAGLKIVPSTNALPGPVAPKPSARTPRSPR